MHVRELAELAAILAWQGPALVRDSAAMTSTGMNDYWAVSKGRLDRWTRVLREAANRRAPTSDRPAAPVKPVMEEVLASEVLTRVWTAIVVEHGRRLGLRSSETVARSIYNAHLEARHRALRLLYDAVGLSVEEAVLVNRLRRRAERWIDHLIGSLAPTVDAYEFAIEPRRARGFADDADARRREDTRLVRSIELASLRMAFHRACEPVSPNPDLNEALAASILACCDAAAFDSVGLLRSRWLLRLSQGARDTEALIGDYFAAGVHTESEESTTPSETREPRFSRWTM